VTLMPRRESFLILVWRLPRSMASPHRFDTSLRVLGLVIPRRWRTTWSDGGSGVWRPRDRAVSQRRTHSCDAGQCSSDFGQASIGRCGRWLRPHVSHATGNHVGADSLGLCRWHPRHGSSQGPVAIGGEKFVVSGRISMDQLSVDVGIPRSRKGSGLCCGGTLRRATPVPMIGQKLVERLLTKL